MIKNEEPYIVVLGSGIDLQGTLPSTQYQRLNKAIELHGRYPSSKIILSGKYSFLYGKKKPSTTEAKEMKKYLLDKGISGSQIHLEQFSRDTIGNAYYLKKYVFLPREAKRALVITSHFQLRRARSIFRKVFGAGYDFHFFGVEDRYSEATERKVIARQNALQLKTQALLSTMKDGDHNFLKGKLYRISFYKDTRPDWVRKFVAEGKI